MPGLLSTDHPAPFPELPLYPNTLASDLPPKLNLKAEVNEKGYLYLSWDSVFHNSSIVSLQLFAYPQKDGPADSSLWKKVASLSTPPLPVAVLLRCLIGNRHYHFSIRAVDRYHRVGPFSDPVTYFNKTK